MHIHVEIKLPAYCSSINHFKRANDYDYDNEWLISIPFHIIKNERLMSNFKFFLLLLTHGRFDNKNRIHFWTYWSKFGYGQMVNSLTEIIWFSYYVNEYFHRQLEMMTGLRLWSRTKNKRRKERKTRGKCWLYFLIFFIKLAEVALITPANGHSVGVFGWKV